MSTLEKLLVLGVLVLVGVILAISLFWSRQDPMKGGTGGDSMVAHRESALPSSPQLGDDKAPASLDGGAASSSPAAKTADPIPPLSFTRRTYSPLARPS